MKGLVITVGNELMGDDGAGPLLARLLEQKRIPGWEVINGGPAPENYLHQVRDLKPGAVVVVDACEMNLQAGSIRLISEKDIACEFFLTTHRLPLSFFISALKELVPEVYFIGIQPAVVAFGLPVSPEVKQAVETVYQKLQAGKLDFQCLGQLGEKEDA
ncbi:hydrogenase 3 maturation endopeptidase HyCI [Moorella thermoacetica]|uniref:Hydrogenase 3 maturation peptidase Hycl, Aspartic peptidase, MEROPS family A31 n=1 Tax=Moorella thermoacetica (strain ATCC 39073 / JCM 9320) TaxID=264732 RepID=Q2RGG8_MOOTA|nr:hydrogenase maturation peptidase HycI [Moorella thermoacetica]AKX95024.1 hydrogenase 3 maturation protease [Moorella thermoacetica]AKX97650.1 hydrogenase 3 maturation protease [Moorella thermoacetica]OIQ53939.1 hydrogenase 3 maturation protease [Moorella thermoacetica]OIQ59438.1 hydrogenase 3 maturation protease [Moorella thermoacetica]QDA01472.1 Hydrogenase 3 maturation protease [Moorella thermoacetica]